MSNSWGWVSTSMPRVNLVLNSGMATAPVGPRMGSSTIAQHLRGGEDAHGVPVIQRDLLGIHPGEILQHADHGGIIVAQHVQLEQVGLHGVIFEVSGNDVAVGIVGGVLHRTEVVDLPVLGDDHHAAGVLAGGAA